MATDSSELTFVRCPACRSLVPAVSPRCRMCGAALEAGAKGGATAPAKEEAKSSRVRQRTTSSQQGDIGNALGRVRDENGEVSANGTHSGGTSDPISIKPTGGRIGNPTRTMEAVRATSAVQFDDQDDWSSDTSPQVEAKPLPRRESPTAELGPIAPIDPLPVSQVAQPDSSSPGPELEDPLQNYIESVPQAVAEPADVDVAATQSDVSNEPALATADPEMEAPPVVAKSDTSSRFKAKWDRPEERQTQRVIVAPPAVEPDASNDRPSANVRAAKGGKPAQLRSVEGIAPVSEPEHAGRLAGWLVSYRNDPDGAAIELREGKFFITGSSLKPSDIVLNDSSVSTPHALIRIDPSGVVRVQDLMSERGIAIRRRGERNFKPSDEHSEVGHGDYIRFGAVEFLVTLVPYVGEK